MNHAGNISLILSLRNQANISSFDIYISLI